MSVTVDVARSGRGVSINFFCAVHGALRRFHPGASPHVPFRTLNRWIAALGRIEREYRKLADAAERPKARMP